MFYSWRTMLDFWKSVCILEPLEPSLCVCLYVFVVCAHVHVYRRHEVSFSTTLCPMSLRHRMYPILSFTEPGVFCFGWAAWYIWLCLIFSSKNKTKQTWVGDDNSVVICIDHSSRSPGSITGTHLRVSIIPIPGDPMLSSGLWRRCMHVIHRYHAGKHPYTWKERKKKTLKTRVLGIWTQAFKLAKQLLTNEACFLIHLAWVLSIPF